jgi:hypothetical protein
VGSREGIEYPRVPIRVRRRGGGGLRLRLFGRQREAGPVGIGVDNGDDAEPPSEFSAVVNIASVDEGC